MLFIILNTFIINSPTNTTGFYMTKGYFHEFENAFNFTTGLKPSNFIPNDLNTARLTNVVYFISYYRSNIKFIFNATQIY